MLVFDYKGNLIGIVYRLLDNKYRILFDGKERIVTGLPDIMYNIIPTISEIDLNYYQMPVFDEWLYIGRSNGIIPSHDYWFMFSPHEEVWIPLIKGVQKYTNYSSVASIGEVIPYFTNLRARVGNKYMELFPKDFRILLQENGMHMHKTRGYFHDIEQNSCGKVLLGRIIIKFDWCDRYD